MDIDIRVKRAYEAAGPDDGCRVLVDRLWPRGLSKEKFTFDLWCKALAPTPGLRKWFGHKAEHWAGFREAYENELRSPEQRARMRELLRQASQPVVTLLYAARDTEHNHAVVLAAELARQARK